MAGYTGEMKSLSILLLLALPTMAGDTHPVQQTGRFNITTVTYLDANQQSVTATLKLDSQTGQTWRLAEIATTNGDKQTVHVLGWDPLGDNLMEDVLIASRLTTNITHNTGTNPSAVQTSKP